MSALSQDFVEEFFSYLLEHSTMTNELAGPIGDSTRTGVGLDDSHPTAQHPDLQSQDGVIPSSQLNPTTHVLSGRSLEFDGNENMAFSACSVVPNIPSQQADITQQTGEELAIHPAQDAPSVDVGIHEGKESSEFSYDGMPTEDEIFPQQIKSRSKKLWAPFIARRSSRRVVRKRSVKPQRLSKQSPLKSIGGLQKKSRGKPQKKTRREQAREADALIPGPEYGRGYTTIPPPVIDSIPARQARNEKSHGTQNGVPPVNSKHSTAVASTSNGRREIQEASKDGEGDPILPHIEMAPPRQAPTGNEIQEKVQAMLAENERIRQEKEAREVTNEKTEREAPSGTKKAFHKIMRVFKFRKDKQKARKLVISGPILEPIVPEKGVASGKAAFSIPHSQISGTVDDSEELTPRRLATMDYHNELRSMQPKKERRQGSRHSETPSEEQKKQEAEAVEPKKYPMVPHYVPKKPPGVSALSMKEAQESQEVNDQIRAEEGLVLKRSSNFDKSTVSPVREETEHQSSFKFRTIESHGSASNVAGSTQEARYDTVLTSSPMAESTPLRVRQIEIHTASLPMPTRPAPKPLGPHRRTSASPAKPLRSALRYSTGLPKRTNSQVIRNRSKRGAKRVRGEEEVDDEDDEVQDEQDDSGASFCKKHPSPNPEQLRGFSVALHSVPDGDENRLSRSAYDEMRAADVDLRTRNPNAAVHRRYEIFGSPLLSAAVADNTMSSIDELQRDNPQYNI